MREYCFTTITEVSEQIRKKEVSPVTLVEECLDRIAKLNPTLNAFITVTGEEALQDARIAESEINEGRWKGPLHGVPIGLKDFYDTAGIRTTAAFVHFQNRIPKKDAVVVTKLKDAGAIIIGKTNMHELGMGTTSTVSHFGSVHNPWNLDYVAGGSSGGSAAAVATGLCFATVDTDAVGSCRLPAACCGVTGFKATYGLISTKGILEGEKADDVILKLAHAAITARSVQDIALVLNAVADIDISKSKFNKDYSKSFGGHKSQTLGVVTNYTSAPEIKEIFLKAAEIFKSLGYSLVEIEVPFASAVFDIRTIKNDRTSISEKLFKEVDVLILPTTTHPTPTIKAAQKAGPQAVAADNTFFSNYFALPAISIPCGFDKNKLPVGIQIVGPAWGEGVVLDCANAFQKHTEWYVQHPVE